MYQFTVNIRVRYAETDQMGYCYYGNYAQYFEVARIETLRSLGVSYKDLENSGILLPRNIMMITRYCQTSTKYILYFFQEEKNLNILHIWSWGS